MDIKESLIRQNQFVRHPWEAARLYVIRTLFGPYLEPISKSGRILEIGFGDGYIIRELAKQYPGIRFSGVDTAYKPPTVDSGRALLNPENVALYSSYSALEPSERSFDGILLLDVIEHIQDDVGFLQNVIQSDLLKPGGVVFITVPAYNGLCSSHDRFLGHVRRYSLPGLIRLVERTGSPIIDKRGYFFLLPLISRACRILAEKCRLLQVPDSKGVSQWRFGPQITRFLSEILKLDFKMSQWVLDTGFMIPGLSCYALYRCSGTLDQTHS